MQKLIIFLIVLSVLTFVSCSDDDPVSSPETKPVNSVIIDPTEITFNAIGQNKQFTAKAYDETGGEVSTTLSWSSSNDGVVMIGSDGMAEATGIGNASIYVTAGEKADTAQVIVELAVEPEIWWVSAKSGDWSDPTKWNTGVVPQPDDTVAITLEGDYTVTLTTDVTISHISLGAATGTQKLATGTNQFTIEEGILTGGAELQIDGTVILTDKLDWKDGDITGTGTMEIERNAEVHAGGGNDSQLTLKATLNNMGVFNIVSGVTININGGTIENKGKVDFQSDDAWLTTFAGGKILNSGDLVKSAGFGDAWISSGDADSFVSNGYINIESGNLNVRGGDLSNVIDIDKGAELHQSGNTLIRLPFYNRGEGTFEIGGSITLGENAGEEIKIRNVVLDSWQSENSITGPGDLTILNSLVWHAGGISGAGKVMIHGDANATLEGTGSKRISERIFEVHRSLESESLLNLTMSKGAQLHIVRTAKWTHTGGGNIRKGEGDMPAIIITETFTKKGSGALVVETDFICAGTMFLEEDVLTVKGAFELQESGKIIGGGTDTDNEVNNRRLQVPEATSAILAGTIELDANGAPAHMSILGEVTIASTFKVLIDADPFESIDAERLTFETGGVELAGTLDVNVKTIPPNGSQYRVISTVNAKGSFDTIEGTNIFTEVREDDQGVLLIYN